MKQDITGVAVTKAAKQASNTLSAMRTLIPLGPNNATMTKAELRKRLRDFRGSQLLGLLEQQALGETGREEIMKETRRRATGVADG